jgi:hypothetical protein
MSKNPDFEIEQVEQYIDYLAKNTPDLEKTRDSHFFPVLQKIFFYQAYEVRRDATFNDLAFPFDCVDVLGGRRRILVHFAATRAQVSVLPPFAIKRGVDEAPSYPRLLIVQNRPNDASVSVLTDARSHWVSILDFTGLKSFARAGFEGQRAREQSIAVMMVQDLMERLAVEIARQKVKLEDLEWRDLERLMGAVLQGLGYRCIVTPPAKDGGRDLVVCDITGDDVAWYNFEIKHWRDRSADQRAVRYCLEVALREGRRGALLVSTGGIGAAALKARAEVHADYVRLAGAAKVVTTCRHFVSRQSGLWTEDLPLRRVLFEETL